jgi:hypothetical protein
VVKVRTESQLRRAAGLAAPGVRRVVAELRADITFDAGADLGDIEVRGDFVLRGNGRRIDANGVDRAFDIAGSADVRLRNVVITGGRPEPGGNGGAIRSGGRLTLNRATLVANNVVGPEASGGAIFVDEGGKLTLKRSAVVRNGAERSGGGIGTASNSFSRIVKSTLKRNAAGTATTAGFGGAVHIEGDGEVLVEGSRIARNRASDEGGGLWNSRTGSIQVLASRLVKNRALGADATSGGGGIYSAGGTTLVRASALLSNAASGAAGSGGAILNFAGDLVVERSSVNFNTASRAGGGIEQNDDTEVRTIASTRIVRSELRGNSAGSGPGNGGALHISGEGDSFLKRVRVIDNIARNEGGGLWNAAGTMRVRLSVVAGNRAGGETGGGGIFNAGGALDVARSTLSQNRATGDAGSGGGLFNQNGEVRVRATEFTGNRARRAGGAIETAGPGNPVPGVPVEASGVVRLDDVSLTRNRANGTPGNGGGLNVTDESIVRWDGGLVQFNKAAGEGGGLWNSATGTIEAINLVVRRNAAPRDQNVHNEGGSFTLNGVRVE